jgi:hypothetical protein
MPDPEEIPYRNRYREKPEASEGRPFATKKVNRGSRGKRVR